MPGVTLEIPVAWGDMDSLAHVNNLIYLRWFESARVHYFEQLGVAAGMTARQTGPILARQEIDYRLPVTYPDTVRVTTNVVKMGTTSWVMRFQVWTKKAQAIAAEGQGVMVLYDYAKGVKVALPPELVARINELERA
jgi:acyl-CoA thioester hydrolase